MQDMQNYFITNKQIMKKLITLTIASSILLAGNAFADDAMTTNKAVST
jgi:hypothetical protein